VDPHSGMLLLLLVLMLIMSAFFSASETSMMAINRLRLRHRAKEDPSARSLLQLLERPDRLISVILLGNNFANTLASSLATVLTIQFLGDAGIAVAALATTFIVLIFSEITPKTLAALYPEAIAYPASRVIRPLLILLGPLVYVTNLAGNGLLALFGIRVHGNDHHHHLSLDELRTMLYESGNRMSNQHRDMLVSILDLENVTVEDIMVPRADISGIDLNEPLQAIVETISYTHHTRLPLYQGSIDNIVGIVHVRKLIPLFQQDHFSKETLRATAREMYYIPEGTPLSVVLLNFQKHHRRIGMVVNEYGDILGLATLEDILEEIVGQFTTSPDAFDQEIFHDEMGNVLLDSSITVRDLNKALHINLPTSGPKTLNGLLLEYLEAIPDAPTSVRIAGIPMELVQLSGKSIKLVRILAQYLPTSAQPPWPGRIPLKKD